MRNVAGMAFAIAATLLSEGALADPGRCIDYADGKRIGIMDAKRLDEVSGMAASGHFPHIIWVHNDSGDDPEIYAIAEDGELVSTIEVDNADLVDWEDIAVSRCTDTSTRQCIYIADTGNNDLDRHDQVIYRLDEPDPEGTSTSVSAEVMSIRFEHPADIEAMFLDGQAQIWLVSKTEHGANLFRVGVFSADATVVAEPVAARDDIDFITAADANEDGTRVILRSSRYSWEFYRPPGRTMVSAFLGNLLRVKLDKEAQGEAVAYSPDGTGFFSTSEGRNAPVRWYSCKAMDTNLPGKEDAAVIFNDPGMALEVDTGCAVGSTSLSGVVILLLHRRRRRP